MTTEGFTSDAEKIEYLVRKNMESSQANRKLIEEKILLVNHCRELISAFDLAKAVAQMGRVSEIAAEAIIKTEKLLNKVDPQYV